MGSSGTNPALWIASIIYYLKNFQPCTVLQTAAPFKISIELEKDVFVLSGAWDKETILNPHKESRKELQDRSLHDRPHSP